MGLWAARLGRNPYLRSVDLKSQGTRHLRGGATKMVGGLALSAGSRAIRASSICAMEILGSLLRCGPPIIVREGWRTTRMLCPLHVCTLGTTLQGLSTSPPANGTSTFAQDAGLGRY